LLEFFGTSDADLDGVQQKALPNSFDATGFDLGELSVVVDDPAFHSSFCE